jgi:hypothetical protein
MSDDVEIVPPDQDGPTDDSEPAVHEPGKLMRIGLMLREMLEEVRRAETDEAGRQRIRQIHDRALEELRSVLSGDLRAELDALAFPFEDDGTPTESEIRIAQAQLIGWLEGLFQGIQAALFSQQLMARQQLEQMRQRGLPPGGMPPPGMRPGAGEEPGEATRRGTGQYL